MITNIYDSHGLQVNPSKSELYLINPESNGSTQVQESFNLIMPGIKVISKSDLKLLGAPIYVEAIEQVLKDKIQTLEFMIERLKQIDNHEALFLLRHCFGIPKLTYILRTAPCFMKSNILEKFDSTIKRSLISILNITIPERAYTQATLPIAYGGLGIRLATDVALAGFLSSVTASESLVNAILPITMSKQRNLPYEMALQKWKDLSGLQTLPQNQKYQSEWDKGLYEFRYESLIQSAPED